MKMTSTGVTSMKRRPRYTYTYYRSVVHVVDEDTLEPLVAACCMLEVEIYDSHHGVPFVRTLDEPVVMRDWIGSPRDVPEHIRSVHGGEVTFELDMYQFEFMRELAEFDDPRYWQLEMPDHAVIEDYRSEPVT